MVARPPIAFVSMTEQTLPTVLGAIGRTPLVELRHVVPAGHARVLVKLEGSNPSGSMKDRMALASVEAAERDGRLQPGGTVVEWTGGSTGTSLALVCAAKGYPLRIVSSDAFSLEKRDHMRALGADLEVVPSEGGRITPDLFPKMIARARALSEEPGSWWVDQLHNREAAGGYEPIGDEMWAATGGGIDAFVQGVGTGHSFRGVVDGLRRHNPKLHSVAVEPAESPALSRGTSGSHKIEGMGLGYPPPLWDPVFATEIEAVSTDDAYAMARRLAREEAIFGGASTGANVVAAIRLAERLGPRRSVTTLQPDTGLKYLSTAIYRV